MPKFEHTDPWIFLSIARVTEKDWVDLESLIASADQINQAIPSILEVEGAINRLTCVDLVSVRSDRFAISKLGESLLRETVVQSEAVLDQWGYLEKLLVTKPWTEVTTSPVKISEQKFEEAYEKYCKDCQQILKIILSEPRAL